MPLSLSHSARSPRRSWSCFDTRYWDFTAKHFHEKTVADHGFKRSYNWLRPELASPWAQARGAQAWGAPAQAAAPCCPA